MKEFNRIYKFVDYIASRHTTYGQEEAIEGYRVTIRPQEDCRLYCPRSRAGGDSRFVETQIAYASALRREGDARRESPISSANEPLNPFTINAVNLCLSSSIVPYLRVQRSSLNIARRNRIVDRARSGMQNRS